MPIKTQEELVDAKPTETKSDSYKKVNPLSKFRTYSYYHVLVACDKVETGEELCGDVPRDTWFHTEDPVKTTPAGGKYVVLINGATDANYVMTELKWSAWQAADVGGSQYSTSIATTGSFAVSEPRNVLFVNSLIEAARALGIDFSALPMLIKTFFVGHPVDHDGEYAPDKVVIGDVSPLLVLLTNVSATYTETGGVYGLDFVAWTYGAAKLPQMSKTVDNITLTSEIESNVKREIKSSHQPTLQNIMDTLTALINNRYRQQYSCAMEILKQKGVENPEQNWGTVTYEIELDQEYKNPKYLVVDGSSRQKNSSDCKDPPIFKFAAGTTLEKAIGDILGCCIEIQKEGKQLIIPRLHDMTKPSVVDGKLNMHVKYFIQRFQQPTQQATEKAIKSNDVNPDDLSYLIQNNLFEYDYIYSGLNTEVLSFDMKLNMGYAFFNSQIIGNSSKDQLELIPAKVAGLANLPRTNSRMGETSENAQGVTTTTPLKMPFYSATQAIQMLGTKNSQSPQAKMDYLTALSKWSSLEALNAVIKIAGNPEFLGMISRTTRPTVLQAELTEQNTPASTAGNQSSNISSTALSARWTALPMLAKINIFTPKFDDDQTLFESGEISYTQDFWYKGYFKIMKVENDFSSDGTFTQVLQLLGMPENVGRDNPGEIPGQADITKCFESKSADAAQGQQPKAVNPVKTFTDADFITNSDIQRWKQDTGGKTKEGQTQADAVREWRTDEKNKAAGAAKLVTSNNEPPTAAEQAMQTGPEFNPSTTAANVASRYTPEAKDPKAKNDPCLDDKVPKAPGTPSPTQPPANEPIRTPAHPVPDITAGECTPQAKAAIQAFAGQAGQAALKQAMTKAGMTSKYARASLLAIAGVESGWIPQREKFCYSADRLGQVWAVFRNNPSLAAQYAGLPCTNDKLPNFVYGPDAPIGRGLGNTQPGDGAKFIGRGFIQLTGRSNYTRYGQLTGQDILNNPDLLNTNDTVSADVAIAYLRDRCKVPETDPNYFGAAVRAVGHNTPDIAARKTALYNCYLATGLYA